METDSSTTLQAISDGNSQLLTQVKALPDSEMIPGDHTVPSTMMARAASLIASGEPICIGLMDDNPLFILDPEVMGYYLGREPWQLEHTAGWLEELGEFLGTMASNLREIRKQM